MPSGVQVRFLSPVRPPIAQSGQSTWLLTRVSQVQILLGGLETRTTGSLQDVTRSGQGFGVQRGSAEAMGGEWLTSVTSSFPGSSAAERVAVNH